MAENEVYKVQVNIFEDTMAMCSAEGVVTKITHLYSDTLVGYLTFSKVANLITSNVHQPRKRPVNVKEPVLKKPRPSGGAPAVVPSLVSPIGGKRDVTSLINTITKPESLEKSFQCSFCMYQSIRIGDVKRHIELKHLPSSVVFKCQTCGKDFKLKPDLKRHYMKVHNLAEPAAQAMINC